MARENWNLNFPSGEWKGELHRVKEFCIFKIHYNHCSVVGRRLFGRDGDILRKLSRYMQAKSPHVTRPSQR